MNTDDLSAQVEEELRSRGFNGRSRRGPDGIGYLSLSVVALLEAVKVLKKRGDIVLSGLWAIENFDGRDFTLFYCFERRSAAGLFILQVPLTANRGLSIAGTFPIAAYYEREVADGFGIEFEGAFDTRRLFLHESYPDNFHPLLKSFDGRHIEPADITPKREYRFKEFKGEGMYQIPVGPVHAGIIEPGHFRFSVIGETIFNLEIRHFWKHRGLEKLAEGKTPDEAMKIAETISGDETAANACAFAMAAERIAGIDLPVRASQLRLILLELERIYSHLGDLAGMAVDAAYPVGAAPFFVLREEILRWNAALTGSRFLKETIVPGGLARDIPDDLLKELRAYASVFKTRFKHALEGIYNSVWIIDRLETTGVIDPSLVVPLNLSGPAARASGAHIDTRLDHPYGLYVELNTQTDHCRSR